MPRLWMPCFLGASFVILSRPGPCPAQQVAQPAGPPPARGMAGPGHVGDLPGPLDSLSALAEMPRTFFLLADTDQDGLLSQKEALDAANFVVGGLFYRADADGDGTLSVEEARAFREELMKRQPALRVFSQSARRPDARPEDTGRGAFQNLANLLDANNDRNLQATELRQATQTAVQGLFATADTNRDGQLSPAEIQAATYGIARAAAQAAFQAADVDNNGALSEDEFAKAVEQPTRAMFRILDRNNDGQLSAEELQAAERIISSQMQMMLPDLAGGIGTSRTGSRGQGSGRPAPPDTPKTEYRKWPPD